MNIRFAGGPPLDYSANAAAVPITGVLLATIPAEPNRNSVTVQNQSTNVLQVVRDDGNGNGVSTYMLAAATALAGGGEYKSNSFRGRVRVYGTTGSRVAAFVD